MLNKKLHHVGFTWTFSSRKQTKYDIKENNHPDWLNRYPQYNTAKSLGLNYFIIIMKLDKKWLMKLLKRLFKQIPTLKSKPLSHDKKYQLLLTDIGCAYYFTQFSGWDYYFVNQKTQILFTSEEEFSCRV